MARGSCKFKCLAQSVFFDSAKPALLVCEHQYQKRQGRTQKVLVQKIGARQGGLRTPKSDRWGVLIERVFYETFISIRIFAPVL